MDRKWIPTDEMMDRWAPLFWEIAQPHVTVLERIRRLAELATKDTDFLRYWKDAVWSYPEPTRSRAVSFLARLEKRPEVWNFEEEFRKSFN